MSCRNARPRSGACYNSRLSDVSPGGQVAQLVEQRTENPCVGGSIPPLATNHCFKPSRAAYNFAEHLPERRRMMQAWADYLEGLKGSRFPVAPKPYVFRRALDGAIRRSGRPVLGRACAGVVGKARRSCDRGRRPLRRRERVRSAALAEGHNRRFFSARQGVI